MNYNKPEVSLKGLRMLKDMSQKELGEKLGKSEYTIANWESGKSSPKITDYYKLKDVLDIDNQFFLKF
ncbi:helix-turn-helix transcriptional regulator [Helcococcus ovis]|uniref:helix-turn-helix domain-containing protein n=1 Tax=Helcococcus ovis TaxID=72026 RepID=UPI0038BA33D9